MIGERLREYIRDLGFKEFARLYGCSERTAEAYLYGERRPDTNKARRLMQDGFSFEDIYGPLE